MKFDKMQKGKELLYLPNIDDREGPRKVFFLFQTEDFYSTTTSAKIILTTEQNECTRLLNLDQFRQEQQISVDFNDDNKYIFIFDLNTIGKYTKRRLLKTILFYVFLLKWEKTYKSLERWSNIFNISEPTLFYSTFFIVIRKRNMFRKTLFVLRCLYLCMKGVFKYLIAYPVIFVFDTVKLTFETYSDYRKSITDKKYYELKSMSAKMAYLSIGKDEFEKQKTNNEEIFKKAKEKYLSSNMAFITIMLAFIGILISQIISTNKENDANNQIEKQKIIIEKQDDDIMDLRLKSISNDVLRIDNMTLKLDNDRLKKLVNESIKND